MKYDKITKSQAKEVAENYLVNMLRQHSDIFTDKYFNTEIEESVNSEIKDLFESTASKIESGVKIKSNTMALDDVIDDVLKA